MSPHTHAHIYLLTHLHKNDDQFKTTITPNPMHIQFHPFRIHPPIRIYIEIHDFSILQQRRDQTLKLKNVYYVYKFNKGMRQQHIKYAFLI